MLQSCGWRAVLCVMCVLVQCFALQGQDAETSDGEASPEELAIYQAAEQFVAAYNSKDAAAIAELFTLEGRLEDAGLIFEGREEIREAFAEAFERSPKAAISVVMDSVRLITPDVAVEEGSTEFFPDGETLTSRSRYLAAHLQRDGKWRLVSVRTLEPEVISHYDSLRELEWLIGDWIDEGEDEVIETSCSWDEKKNFILQDFQVIQDGEVTLKGTQRIGWDPQSKQFRSWIFDAEGGFAEARWTRVDDDWVIKSSGVAAGGLSASATRTLTRVDDDHLVFVLTDRLAGAERLPDLEVQMVRMPPQPKEGSDEE